LINKLSKRNEEAIIITPKEEEVINSPKKKEGVINSPKVVDVKNSPKEEEFSKLSLSKNNIVVRKRDISGLMS
jgi:hypothetical protein